jgi:hypothetical protein
MALVRLDVRHCTYTNMVSLADDRDQSGRFGKARLAEE